ncbi:hypothetical protein [Peredibacter starrii]|uniref:DUF2127 domain-containing protein n=1 Tax=Peredibacter starrii TaxID=28202 RepID=A0AAX4HSN5_9BACT|nr:hypothetical protein [Peredibacter starrii]WPU66247.1 hypothetical protein SOO65_05760 [Peredibacter starrii]
MMEKIKAHFMKVGPRRFVVGAVFVLIILDIINTYYLKLYWLKKDLSTMLVHQSIRQSNLLLEDFSQETINGMAGFINNTFYFFLFLVLVNNLFFYFFYLRAKLWAQGYVLFYTLTAAIFGLSFVVDQAGLGAGWMVYNILTIFVYIYLYFGVKVLKYETTDAIPADGTSAQ